MCYLNIATQNKTKRTISYGNHGKAISNFLQRKQHSRIIYIYTIAINEVVFYVNSTYTFIKVLNFRQPKKVGRADDIALL